MRKSYNKYIGAALLGGLLLFTSCNDFLDKTPDNRMELKNPDEVSKLLVAAYPEFHPAYLLEMYSDNTDENTRTGWTEYNKFQGQAYRWEDITETGDRETPRLLWSSHYEAVSTANIALDYIARQADQKSYSAQKGEALICRAYAMFQLANIFCRAYDKTTADKDLGLPYPIHEDNEITKQYERGTLAELYAQIDADIQAGLPLVQNDYSQPKFHFTQNAANAFAARFYLYYQQYDKAITYASKVLGSNPNSVLRDWKSWGELSINYDFQPNQYISTSENANLLLEVTTSNWGGICGPYSIGNKYAHGRMISVYETLQSNGPWGNCEDVFNYRVWSIDELSKYCLRKVPYTFEYTDIQAGIGYPHSVVAAFTTDQLLLERAEAYALSGEYNKAVADINSELKAFSSNGVQVTLDDIKNYYNAVAYYKPEAPTVKKQFHTSFAIDSKVQEPLLQCILHLKRIITIHDGIRLQDVKRYGMTIYRRNITNTNVLTAVTDSMTASDPRQAIQLPQEQISVGLTPNPRNK